MQNKIIQEIEKRQTARKIPDFGPGDTVVVEVKVKEGDRERVQVFQGTVIRLRSGGNNGNFTVRRVASNGIGVERTFPVHTPVIEKIEVVKRGDVRRAKLFYLREVSGKKARIRERKDWLSKKGVVVPSEGAPEGPSTEASAETPQE